MVLLKPRGRLAQIPCRLHQIVNTLTENGVAQHALDLVSRNRLQDYPGVVRELPQSGIKLSPHFVGSVIPRPTHIQGKLRERFLRLDQSTLPRIRSHVEAEYVGNGSLHILADRLEIGWHPAWLARLRELLPELAIEGEGAA